MSPALPATPARCARRVRRRGAALALAVALAGGMLAALVPGSAGAAESGNLLSGTSSALLSGVGSWVGVGATVATVSSPAAPTGATLALTSTVTGTVQAYSGSSPATWKPATPGSVYTAAVDVQAQTTGRTVQGGVVFYDANGTKLKGLVGPPLTDTVGAWARTQKIVALAPAGTAYVATGVILYGAVPGEVHYVAEPSLTSAPGGSPAVAGPLTVSGNKILDRNGSPVVLRGVHRTGLELDHPIPDSEIAQLKAWGANFVRLSLGEHLWLAGTCYTDPGYQTAVDQAVQSVTSRGMVALLDLHWNQMTTCGSFGQQPMADYPNSVTFWQQVAARYKNNPLVAFDLYNEPHDISDAVWRDGGTVTYNGTTFTAAGMQQLYAAVRGTGATNLVFTSGNGWASRPSTLPVSGTNIVTAAHAYTCPTSTTSNCNPGPGGIYDPSGILGRFTGLATPVMVTEFGWPDRNDGVYNRNVISYAESHGWGWDVYAWDGTLSGQFDLLNDVSTATWQPSYAGMPALEGMSANTPAPATSTPTTTTTTTTTSGGKKKKVLADPQMQRMFTWLASRRG